jgi:hypothetical protein
MEGSEEKMLCQICWKVLSMGWGSSATPFAKEVAERNTSM